MAPLSYSYGERKGPGRLSSVVRVYERPDVPGRIFYTCAWKATPGRRQKAESCRRYRERHPERVREQTSRANAKRAAEKRAYMHRYATTYVGPGVTPTCRSCGTEVPFSGRGRPRLDCFECRPESRGERERRAQTTQPTTESRRPR